MRHRKHDEWHGPTNAWAKRPTFYPEAALKSALCQRSMRPAAQWIAAKMPSLAWQQMTANGWLIHASAQPYYAVLFHHECYFTMDDSTLDRQASG
jgi:hypothetical protein